MERCREASASPKNTHDLTLCWPYTDATTTHSNYPNWSDWYVFGNSQGSGHLFQECPSPRALPNIKHWYKIIIYFFPHDTQQMIITAIALKNRQGVLKKEAPTPLVEEKSHMLMCPWDPRNFLQVLYYWKAASGTKLGTLFFWLLSLHWTHHAFYHISFSAHLRAQTSMWYFIFISLFV